jgi:hypothetical protein
MRALGCSTGSIITLGNGTRNAGSCQKLNGAVRSMNSNLAKLKSQYARLSGGGAPKGDKRKALQARYRALGCDKPEGTFVARAEPQGRNGIAQILGGKKPAPKANDAKRRRDTPKTLDIPGLAYGGDTFRTLCVRTSDGYYFPISFSTTKENFKRDMVACQSMCPGTEVKLFMHRVPEEESEDMKTEDGEPYKAMSYAFAYRKDGVSGFAACKFNGANGLTVVNDGTAGTDGIVVTGDKTVSDKPVPLPTARLDPALDRESIADMAGHLTDDDIRALLRPQASTVEVATDVRVVGPVFLPDPSGAIELRSPVRPIVR